MRINDLKRALCLFFAFAMLVPGQPIAFAGETDDWRDAIVTTSYATGTTYPGVKITKNDDGSVTLGKEYSDEANGNGFYAAMPISDVGRAGRCQLVSFDVLLYDAYTDLGENGTDAEILRFGFDFDNIYSRNATVEIRPNNAGRKFTYSGQDYIRGILTYDVGGMQAGPTHGAWSYWFEPIPVNAKNAETEKYINVKFLLNYETKQITAYQDNTQIGSYPMYNNYTPANNKVTDTSRITNFFFATADNAAQPIKVNTSKFVEGYSEDYIKFKNIEIDNDFAYRVNSCNISQYQTDVDPTDITVEFNKPTDGSALLNAISVYDSQNNIVADVKKTVTMSDNGKTASISLRGLKNVEEYTLKIDTSIKAILNTPLENPFELTFTTQEAPIENTALIRGNVKTDGDIYVDFSTPVNLDSLVQNAKLCKISTLVGENPQVEIIADSESKKAKLNFGSLTESEQYELKLDGYTDTESRIYKPYDALKFITVFDENVVTLIPKNYLQSLPSDFVLNTPNGSSVSYDETDGYKISSGTDGGTATVGFTSDFLNSDDGLNGTVIVEYDQKFSAYSDVTGIWFTVMPWIYLKDNVKKGSTGVSDYFAQLTTRVNSWTIGTATNLTLVAEGLENTYSSSTFNSGAMFSNPASWNHIKIAFDFNHDTVTFLTDDNKSLAVYSTSKENKSNGYSIDGFGYSDTKKSAFTWSVAPASNKDADGNVVSYSNIDMYLKNLIVKRDTNNVFDINVAEGTDASNIDALNGIKLSFDGRVDDADIESALTNAYITKDGVKIPNKLKYSKTSDGTYVLSATGGLEYYTDYKLNISQSITNYLDTVLTVDKTGDNAIAFTTGGVMHVPSIDKTANVNYMAAGASVASAELADTVVITGNVVNNTDLTFNPAILAVVYDINGKTIEKKYISLSDISANSVSAIPNTQITGLAVGSVSKVKLFLLNTANYSIQHFPITK